MSLTNGLHWTVGFLVGACVQALLGWVAVGAWAALSVAILIAQGVRGG